MPPAKKAKKNTNAFERDTQEAEEDWGSDDDDAGDDKSEELYEDAEANPPENTLATRQIAPTPTTPTTRGAVATTPSAGSSGKGKKRGKEPLVRRTYSDRCLGYWL